ncbi:MAG: hypothetical protein Q9222_001552, partial [Ikaeria aurantiellina]
MRIFQPQWMALSAVLIPIALNPAFAKDPNQVKTTTGNNNTTLQSSSALSAADPKATAVLLESILHNLTPKRFIRSTRSLEIRAPVETPPTQFLPYPPPPGYVYPPGTNAANQNPQPSEFDPPPGVYGSAYQGGNSASQSSSAAPSLRVPVLLSLLANPRLNALAALLPTNIVLPRNIKHLRLEAREPVETPPTQFLPYPPPPGYVYPQGESPETQNPKPSEFNPPAGVYGGASNSGQQQQQQSNTNGYNTAGSANQPLTQSTGGGGLHVGPGHLAWILAVTIIATMAVTFLGT